MKGLIMNRQICMCFVFILYLTISINASASIILVGEGTSYKTIQEGVNACKYDDTIILKEGLYRGSGNYNIKIIQKKINFRSLSGYEKTIIDCQSSGFAFLFDEAEGTINGLSIINAKNTEGSSFYNDYSFHVGKKDLSGAVMTYKSRVTLLNCKISNNSECGIVNYGSDTIIKNCIINHNNRNGITNAVSNTDIYNCTIVYNEEYGVYTTKGTIFAGPSDTDIKNTIFWENGQKDIFNHDSIWFWADCDTSVDFSNVTNGDGHDNIRIDPLFVNENSENFSLKSKSPCIDAGEYIYGMYSDIRDSLRPINKKFDMGAFEYPGGKKPFQKISVNGIHDQNVYVSTEMPVSIKWHFNNPFPNNDQKIIDNQKYTISIFLVRYDENSYKIQVVSRSLLVDIEYPYISNNYNCQFFDNDIGSWKIGVALGNSTISKMSQIVISEYDIVISQKPNILPKVEIDLPNNMVLADKTVSVSGKSSDEDGEITDIQIKINDGNWQNISVSDKWNITLQLQSGDNTVYARAKDNKDQWSKIAKKRVICSSQKVDWTWMIYLYAGSDIFNPLDEINEMEATGSLQGKTHYVVFLDSIHDNNDTIFYITKDNTKSIISPSIDTGINFFRIREKWKHVHHFINWTMSTFPADRYGLSIWDHEAKLFRNNDINKNNIGHLKLQDMQKALSLSDNGTDQLIDILLLDMDMSLYIETIYQLKDSANIIIGPETKIHSEGFNYSKFCSRLNNISTLDSIYIANQIVKDYVSYYSESELELQESILSAISTQVFTQDFLEAFNSLNEVLIESMHIHKEKFKIHRNSSISPVSDYDIQRDLGDFLYRLQEDIDLPEELNHKAESLLDALNKMVIAKEYTGNDTKYMCGLSIWFPPAISSTSEKQYYLDENSFSFVQTLWDEYLDMYENPRVLKAKIDIVQSNIPESVIFIGGNYVFSIQNSGEKELLWDYFELPDWISLTAKDRSIDIDNFKTIEIKISKNSTSVPRNYTINVFNTIFPEDIVSIPVFQEGLPIPQARLTGSQKICPGDDATLQFIVFDGFAPYTLVYSDGSKVYTINEKYNNFSTIVSPQKNTTYSMISITDSNHIINSSVSSQAEITIFPMPVPDFRPIALCSGIDIVFKNETQYPEYVQIYEWDFNQDRITDSMAKEGVHQFDKAGEFKVTLKILTKGGCFVEKTKSFVLGAPPVFQENAIEGPTMACAGKAEYTYLNRYTSFVDNNASYEWSVSSDDATLLSSPYEKDVLISFTTSEPEDSIVNIQLTATNSCGNRMISYPVMLDTECVFPGDITSGGTLDDELDSDGRLKNPTEMTDYNILSSFSQLYLKEENRFGPPRLNSCNPVSGECYHDTRFYYLWAPQPSLNWPSWQSIELNHPEIANGIVQIFIHGNLKHLDADGNGFIDYEYSSQSSYDPSTPPGNDAETIAYAIANNPSIRSVFDSHSKRKRYMFNGFNKPSDISMHIVSESRSLTYTEKIFEITMGRPDKPIENVIGVNFEIHMEKGIWQDTQFIYQYTDDYNLVVYSHLGKMGDNLAAMPLIHNTHKNIAIIGMNRKDSEGVTFAGEMLLRIKTRFTNAIHTNISEKLIRRIPVEIALTNSNTINESYNVTPVTSASTLIYVDDTSLSGRPDKSISGYVHYYSNDKGNQLKPVPGVQITLDGDSFYTTTTDQFGQYTIEDLPSGNYSLHAQKTDNSKADIGAIDAARIAQYSVGLIDLNCYETIAADVSRNGTVSAMDASIVARYKTGLADCMNDHCMQWIFLPTPIVFCDEWSTGIIDYPEQKSFYIDTEQLNVNFSGIKLGDVSGNWSDPSPVKLKRTINKRKKYQMPPVVYEISKNSFLSVPVFINHSVNIEGIDLRLRFDHQILSFHHADFSDSLLKNNDYQLIFNEYEKGNVSVSIFAQTESISTDGEIVYLYFDAIENGQTTLSLDLFEINESSASGGFRLNEKITQQIQLIIGDNEVFFH